MRESLPIIMRSARFMRLVLSNEGGSVAENTQAGQRLSEALTGDMIADVMSGTRRIDLTDLEAAVEVLSDIDIPAELRDNLALFLRLERRILREYDAQVLDVFDELMVSVIRANAGDPGAEPMARMLTSRACPRGTTPSPAPSATPSPSSTHCPSTKLRSSYAPSRRFPPGEPLRGELSRGYPARA